jgi:glycerol-3-phosphate dehydrogenase
MVRDLERMANTPHDLLIIGGGITGACVAWDGALRGLRVALVEREDFGGATSAATSKLIHGGLRYLQQKEFALVRESLHERRILELIAPHMVYPIPFLLPVYRGGKGKVPLTLGMIVYELLAYDKGRIDDRSKRIPTHRDLAAEEVLEMEPSVSAEGLTGGILYYDCQMFSPERLTLEFLLSAADRGAAMANYAGASAFLLDGDRVCGARVEDRITGTRLEVRAGVVANVTGPWADLLLETLPGKARTSAHLVRSKGIHVITRPLTHKSALVLITPEGRHIFVIPWRGHSLIGTTDTPYAGHPDELTVTEEERHDVLSFYAGLRPLVERDGQLDTYRASRRYEIFDHADEGLSGLFTVIGGKYTTARSLASKLIDRVFQAMGEEPPECKTEAIPLHGGNVGRCDSFLRRVVETQGGLLPPPVLENLVRSYGARYEDVMNLVHEDAELRRPMHPELPEIGAQVVHAVRREMALSLADVVFRRTGLGTLKHPGRASLERACDLMARDLGWRRSRRRAELERVERALPEDPSADLRERGLLLLEHIHRLLAARDHPRGDDALHEALQVGQAVHDVEHGPLQDGAKPPGPALALDGLLGSGHQGILGESQLDPLQLEEGLILFDQRVFGLHQDLDQVSLIQLPQRGHDGEPTHELGDHAELDEVLGPQIRHGGRLLPLHCGVPAEPQGLEMGPLLHDLVQPHEGPAANEEDVGGVHLVVLPLHPLGVEVHHRPFQHLEQGLLDALPGDVASIGGVHDALGDLVGLVDVHDTLLRLLLIEVGVLQEAHDDILHVLPHIARLGDGRGVGNGEGDLKDLGEGLGQEGLSGAGGADEQNVALLQLHALDGLLGVDALVVIVNGHGEGLLGLLLADHIVIQCPLDAGGFGKAAQALHAELLGQDVIADLNALVADERLGARDELSDFAFTLAAEGTVQS